jgi:hypothetical protein
MNPELKISHSPEIKEFVSALAKAQGVMKPAVFNRTNPHFKTKYADFTSCMDACRGPLSENGLAAIQYCETIEGKLNLVTMLAHVSGQWMKSEFPLIPSKMDSQGIGSAMTYAKRYSLCGMVGIVADEEGDDDGEAAVGRGNQKSSETQKSTQALKPAPQPKSVEKILPSQVSQLKYLEENLDDECRSKLYSWLGSAYKIANLEDVIADNFQKVLCAFENAAKFMHQQKLEVVNA